MWHPSGTGETTRGGNGYLSGFDENLDVQGELILQDAFQVWDPKSLIRKGRERHLFLFEISLVFSKEIKDSSGHTKYVYKNKLLVGGAAGVRQVSLLSYSPWAQRALEHSAHLSPGTTPKPSWTNENASYVESCPPRLPLLHLRVHRSSCCLLLAPPSSPSLPAAC